MRGIGIICVLNAILLVSASVNEEDAAVARALKEATEFHEQLSRSELLRSTAQSPARRRGGTKTTPYTEEVGRISNINLKAFEILLERENMNVTSAIGALSRQTMPAACQQPQLNCNFNSRYRTIDGTCNNVNRPLWGAVNQPLARVTPSAYENGRDVPRGGRPTSRLPGARLVSTVIHPDSNTPHPSVTNMVPQFGQFLDHDISLTPEGGQQCCGGQQTADCWPILIPSNDPFYSTLSNRQTCMDFTRSTAYCFQTTSGVREQMNTNTAFIDGSQIYGSSANRAQQLRTLSGGRLRTSGQLTGFLPETSTIAPTMAASIGNFIAGDDRINEMPALAVMHNLFLMEHNRLAGLIRTLRPAFTDEQIYQETRRIVSAELQQVTYNEYLPIILGQNTMNQYNLNLGTTYTTYDPSVDATIFNSFATAAYRFGHSLVNGLVRLVSGGNVIGSYRVRDNYGQSGQITQSNGQGYDWILGGLMTQNSQQFDPFVTEDMTNFLFKTPANNFGGDLVARNIQRGRDHGLPGYNTFRTLCGLPAITSFAAAPAEIRSDAWSRLQNLYASPNDIDLFTGGLTETPVANGLSGPTFNCLKAVQFARLKSGDRYFFTHGGLPGTFSSAAIQQLRARTLGDIICDNSQTNPVLRNVFLIPSTSNPWVACNDASRTKLNVANFV